MEAISGHQFNRLKSSSAKYTEARKALTCEQVVELLVCDRVKATLSESALPY
jgi:hypothetical protein